MSIRPIIYLGDNRLTTSSEPITTFDAALQLLVDDMFETMYVSQGIGLAAPQLGINLRVFTVDVTPDQSEPQCFINPKIIWREGEAWMVEGCLSIPGARGEVLRAAKIKIEASDRHGEALTLEVDGLLARCIQHEYDHLEGTLFIEYLSESERQRAIEQHQQFLRQHRKQSTTGED